MKHIISFMLVFVLTCILAAGMLAGWIWVSYHMQFSTGVIRLGLLPVYFLPCLIGGRVFRIQRIKKAPVLGILLGICFYALLILLSVMIKRAAPVFSVSEAAILILCTAGGAIGAFGKNNGE